MLRAVALALRARLRELRWLREIFLVAQPPSLSKKGNTLAPVPVHRFKLTYHVEFTTIDIGSEPSVC